MRTSDFAYELPPELIAQTPIEPRDASRMLVVDRHSGELMHRHFARLPEYLRPGDLLVVNDSRVMPARLHGRKPSGGHVEILLLRPRPDQGTPEGHEAWECLVRGKGLRTGVQVEIGVGDPPAAVATVLGSTADGGRLVVFNPGLESWLDQVGEVPLPPYIHTSLADPERYQTVYSRAEGSAAAPTAGLHFTPELLTALRANGVALAHVTLHIGLDTFRPVHEEDLDHHQMHREWAELSADTALLINRTRLAGGRIVAVGTTAVRVLESAAKAALGYRPCDDVPEGASCAWQAVAAFSGETDLFIRPGHSFRAVDMLLTNFHLPRSTLLMLVSAFAGKGLIDRAYAEAIAERYRFFSFGDAMLIV